MKFNVLYYAQTADFTCGPACVLMTIKHFYPKLKLNRHLEFEVWRQCNMIGVRGADPYGLAVPLIDAGLEVRLVTQRKSAIEQRLWRYRLQRHYSREEVELSFLGIRENQRRALSRDLLVQHKRPVVDDVLNRVREGFVPIALVHMGVVHSLNIPHWVVITDVNEKKVMFNDPYPPKGRRGLSLSHEKFQKILDDIGTRIGMSPSVLYTRKR
jgi:predicted double-glycine peptidase